MMSVEGCFRCDHYSEPYDCTECYKGYYLDKDIYSCYSCKQGCDSCTNEENC